MEVLRNYFAFEHIVSEMTSILSRAQYIMGMIPADVD